WLVTPVICSLKTPKELASSGFAGCISLTSTCPKFIILVQKLDDPSSHHQSMTALELGRPPRRTNVLRNIIVVILLAGIVAGTYFLVRTLEWHKPQVKITPDTDTLGLAPIEIEINESGTGLKSVTVALSAAGN